MLLIMKYQITTNNILNGRKLSLLESCKITRKRILVDFIVYE